MRIALYVHSWPPGSTANGVVTYASQLVPALRRLGHDVFVLTSHKSASDGDPYTIDLQLFVSTPTIWARAINFARGTAGLDAGSSVIASAVRKAVATHGIDVFEIEESFGWGLSVSHLRLLPVVIRLHGPWFLTGGMFDPYVRKNENRRRIKLEGRAIQQAQFVTAPSAAVLQAAKKHYGLSLTASQVISNPLDAPNESEIWNVSCDTNKLLFVGRFDALKGGDLVLRTFGALAASYPKLRLTFVGPDNGIKLADGNIYSFDQFVRSSLPRSCWSRIEYCGAVSHAEVMSLRREHFVTIVASRQEIFSYAVLEAMSLGCPLVATAVGGVPELIIAQRNGLLVPSENVEAMTAACHLLLQDHALASRLGRQAWRDCHDFYRSDNIAKRTVEAYEQAIQNFKLLRHAD